MNNSSVLMSKLETINWRFTMRINLNGIDTTLLIKYVVENDSYAIMLSDFAMTYFECSIGDQIDLHYQKYNRSKLNHENIVACVQALLDDLPKTVIKIEKLQVDCHTTRITLKCQKQVTSTFRFHWNFHIISTDQDIFLKHFSIPMVRGLMYYYKFHQNQHGLMMDNEILKQEYSGAASIELDPTTAQSSALSNDQVVSSTVKEPLESIDDNILNDIFRYEQ